MDTALEQPCWIPDENNWKESQKDVLMPTSIKTGKIKLNQCGECQRTHPTVDFSSSNNVRCKNPSIVPILFELLFCIALLHIQERRSGTGNCEINMNLKWLYCETQNF